MTSIWEQAYLQWYANNKYSGQGEIVDLGCWLGSATISLARGLLRNKRVKEKNERIHAYDIFIWKAWMDKAAVKSPIEGRYKPGDSFLGEYEKRVKPWKDLIRVHEGDLRKGEWPKENKTEFLFNDAAKSWELINSIVKNFYSSLIPGVSLYVEQDFVHYYTAWIHLIRFRFRDYFKPLMHIPFSSSVVFEYRKPIPDELLKTEYSISSFSAQEIESAFNYSSSLVSKNMRHEIAGAKVMLFVHSGDIDRAFYEFKKAADAGFNLAEVKPYLFTKNRNSLFKI